MFVILNSFFLKKSCGCGRSEEMHSQNAINDYMTHLKEDSLPTKWNFEQHTSDIESIDFGTVHFPSNKKSINSRV